MKVSDYVIDFLVENGASHVFEMIGGAIAHLLDSTYSRDDIACVSVHHEQAAAFAAEAYARINGKIGVAMATSGPGALNMVTGIGSCYFDSVPVLFITGQVNTYEYKFDRPVRQVGFQETDIVSIVKPITKFAELITDASMIRYYLEKALYLAQSGRPGPVLLDIPMNIQRQQVTPSELQSFMNSDEHKSLQTNFDYDESTKQTIEMLKNSKRPIILVGGGVRASGAVTELREFVQTSGIPVVSSLMGLDSISNEYIHNFGLIGSYGNRYSNLALANCDCLLILGSRLDTRQTGTRVDTFARGAKKIHVDIDMNELNEKVSVDLAVHGNVKDFIGELNSKLKVTELPNYNEWYEKIKEYKHKFPSYSPPSEISKIDPNKFIELLSQHSKDGSAICLDVGQHQMWASQSYQLKPNQRLLNSGGMGSMGFALPAALGCAKAKPNEDVIVIAGDGGFQVNIQELDTIVQHNLPIKIFVLNNKNLGMVRVFQDLYFEGRQQSTVTGYNCPNLLGIAEAYGIPSYNISSLDEADKLLPAILNATTPVFVNVELELATVVNPKLVVNRPIEDMSPHLDREELQKLMLIDLVEEMEVPK